MKTTVNTKVAGITFGERQTACAIMMRAKQHGERVYVSLRREKKNPYDKNAVKVLMHCPARKLHYTIGYVPKAQSTQLAPSMDDGKKPFVLSHELRYNNRDRVYYCQLKYSV